MNKSKVYYLHEGLPRQAPGSDASTLDAIQRVGPVPSSPRALDVGCGPGRASLLLAKTLGAHVTAIDIHQPYLDHFSAAAKVAGVENLISPKRMSMVGMGFKPSTFDLIWAGGSAYFTGIERALATWFPLLVPGGRAVFSELCWLTDDPPTEVASYWAQEYPEMRRSCEHLDSAAALGYVDGQSWVLPESDWWTEYLHPLEARMNLLDAEAEDDSELAELIAGSRRAIDLYRRHGSHFGYVFHLVTKPASSSGS